MVNRAHFNVRKASTIRLHYPPAVCTYFCLTFSPNHLSFKRPPRLSHPMTATLLVVEVSVIHPRKARSTFPTYRFDIRCFPFPSLTLAVCFPSHRRRMAKSWISYHEKETSSYCVAHPHRKHPTLHQQVVSARLLLLASARRRPHVRRDTNILVFDVFGILRPLPSAHVQQS